MSATLTIVHGHPVREVVAALTRECSATVVIKDNFGTRTEIVPCDTVSLSSTRRPSQTSFSTPTSIRAPSSGILTETHGQRTSIPSTVGQIQPTTLLTSTIPIPTAIIPITGILQRPGEQKWHNIKYLAVVIPLTIILAMAIFLALAFYYRRQRKKQQSEQTVPRRKKPKVRKMLAEKVKKRVKDIGNRLSFGEWWQKRRRKLIKSSITHTRTVWNMPGEVRDILEGTSTQQGIVEAQRSQSLNALPAFFNPEGNKKVEVDLEDLRTKGLVASSSRPTSPLEIARIPTRPEIPTPVPSYHSNRNSPQQQSAQAQPGPMQIAIFRRASLPPVQEVLTPVASFVRPDASVQSCAASTQYYTEAAPDSMSEFERQYQRDHVHPAFRFDGTPEPSSLSIPIILQRTGTTPENSAIHLALPQHFLSDWRKRAEGKGKEVQDANEGQHPPSANSSSEQITEISEGSASVLEMKKVSHVTLHLDGRKRVICLESTSKTEEGTKEKGEDKKCVDDNSIEPLQPVAMEIERSTSPTPSTRIERNINTNTDSPVSENHQDISLLTRHSTGNGNPLESIGLNIYVPTSYSGQDLPLHDSHAHNKGLDLKEQLSYLPMGKLHIPAWIHSAPSEVCGYGGASDLFSQEDIHNYAEYDGDELVEPKDSISVVENWLEKEKVGPDGRPFQRENSLEKKAMEKEIKNMEKFLKRMELEHRRKEEMEYDGE